MLGDLGLLEPAAKAAPGDRVVLNHTTATKWVVLHEPCGGAVVLARRRRFGAGWRYLLECVCESRHELGGRDFELAARKPGWREASAVAPSRQRVGPHGCVHCHGYVAAVWEQALQLNVLTCANCGRE